MSRWPVKTLRLVFLDEQLVAVRAARRLVGAMKDSDLEHTMFTVLQVLKQAREAEIARQIESGEFVWKGR